MSLVLADRLRAPGAASGRSCGGCTACCTVMAVAELRKPSRRACDHVGYDGCRIHPERPAGCREFHCAWLRGAIEGDESLRPDAVGLVVDHFEVRGTGARHTIVYELWQDALRAPDAQRLLDALAAVGPVDVSRRDGHWAVLTR